MAAKSQNHKEEKQKEAQEEKQSLAEVEQNANEQLIETPEFVSQTLAYEAEQSQGTPPEEAQEVQPDSAAPAVAVVGQPKEKIRIGDRTFDSQKEAWSYAEELERQRLAADAYRQGIQDALQRDNPQAQNEPPPPEENFEEKFYADPKKFLDEYGQKIRDNVTREVLGQVEKQSKVTKLWEQFYNENPDLQSQRALVQAILQQEWDTLGHMPDHGKALKLLAEKTRGELNKYFEQLKPRQELPNTKAGASPGGQVTTTRPQVDKKPLDFLSQVRHLQDKRRSVST